MEWRDIGAFVALFWIPRGRKGAEERRAEKRRDDAISMTTFVNKIREKVRERMDWLYLRLSDCDGMCDHCEPQLKELCLRRKGKTEEDLQLIKKVHSYREILNYIEDPEERKRILKWLADNGEISSKYQYAMVAAGLEEKKRYLKMAADDGYPAARYELGMPMDNSEKRKRQLKTAADQGSP